MSRGSVAALAILVATSAGAQEVCGSLENAFGPFDYRTARAEERNVVERHHFDSNVETLRKGLSGTLGQDIDYTLRAFPNHPRALMSMINLSEKEKRERPAGAHYSVSCYIERAIRWRPDDASVRMVAGIYNYKRGRQEEALRQLEEARRLAGDHPNINYNIGLVYFDLKDYDKALEAAHKAYAGGFELPGLRNKLEKVGKWRPPDVVASPQAVGPATSVPDSLPK